MSCCSAADAQNQNNDLRRNEGTSQSSLTGQEREAARQRPQNPGERIAYRLGFLIANPGVREAARKAAKKKIREQYQGQKIAGDFEKSYFEILGRNRADQAARKPIVGMVPSEMKQDAGRRVG